MLGFPVFASMMTASWPEKAIPAESEFLSEMGRRLDTVGCDLLDESLGIRPGESGVWRAFEAHLWEMATCVSGGGGSVICRRPGSYLASCC